MIIRESPLAKQTNPETNWPPKSPHEVLLSSPSRLKRLQQSRDRSVSPTPAKRPRYDAAIGDDSSDDEEDEETLQLQLAAIKARLKLKKLQKAKENAPHAGEYGKSQGETKSESEIQVVHSPKRQHQAPTAPESPKRVLLGIDKGLKASDVSLKRARGVDVNRNATSEASRRFPIKPTKTFSERLRESRVQDQQREEKEERGRHSKSKGFGVAQSQDGKRVQGNDSTTRVSLAKRDSLSSISRNESGSANQTSRSVRSGARFQPQESQTPIIADRPNDHSAPESSDTIIESNSGFHLSKRLIDESTLGDGLGGKTVVSIPQLLKDITSPNYEIPDFPTEDFVVLGIIASKSSPRDKASTHSINSSADPDSSAKSKFMALTLTDLQWSLDLFLFDTGFSRFWKLTVGTVIAILNPGIMPPKPHLRDTGRFSLKLSSSEDTVLEVGIAQDLGFCKSVKKDGKECGQWIDKRKTEYCDFHVNLAIEKTTAGRMEINGMTGIGLYGNSGQLGGSKRGSRSDIGGWCGGTRGGKGNTTGLKREGQYHDRHLNETGYIIPPEFSTTRSAAKLLDAEDYVQGALSAKERSRKRLAEHEKERELSRKLATAGNGMGLEYLRIKGRAGDGDKGGTGESGKRDDMKEGKLDASELGLVGSSAAEVKLSPVKVAGKRRREDVGAQPMGWGGAFKRDLPTRKERRVAEGQDLATNKPQSLTGIAAKRKSEISGPTALAKVVDVAVHDDDDDDDLDII